jgi:magnesium and cobalt exporter, CNNM family
VGADITAIVLCLLGSAFFSASETALTSLPHTRLEGLRERSGRLTRRGLERWAEAPAELLITILIGNNLVNVLASAIATTIAYRLTTHSGLASVVGIMTLVILVFGEITPKSLAQIHAEWLSARVAAPLWALDVALRPLTWVLGSLARLFSEGRRAEVPVTEEDLLFMLRLAHRHAQLPRGARYMIESVLRFNDTVAREVMVPRPLVHTVDRGWEHDELRAAVLASGHSRFPVVDGSPDAVVGVLHAKLLLGLDPLTAWQTLVTEALFIPEAKPLPKLLQDFRNSGQHMAIVLDEFGGSAGVVTLEDALEMVVGEIEDEFDRRRPEEVVVVEDGWVVPGHLALRRLERLLHRRLPVPKEIDSVGGMAVLLREHSTSGRLVWGGVELEVLEEENGRPSSVRVRHFPARV